MAESRRSMLTDPSSRGYQLAVKMVKQILAEAVKGTGKSDGAGKVFLDSALPYGDVKFLREEFGYDMVSQPQGVFMRTPFLSAYAKCVSRSLEGQKSWKGEETVHVNGDIRQLVVRGFCGSKVVRYYNDPAVHENFFEEDAFVKRTLNSKNCRMREHAEQLWEQMSEGDGAFFSKRGAYSRIVGDTVYFDPLRVQCGLHDVAAEVVRRGAQRAKGWLPFSSDVLRASSGELFGGRVSFNVDMKHGKVVFFEKGVEFIAFGYRLMDYFSYLTREPFVCDGAGFVLEIHGSPQGRLDWILSRVNADEISKVVVEKVPVWSKDFDKPGVLVSLNVRLSPCSSGVERVVLRDDPVLFSKSVAMLVGGSSPITVKSARSTRAMYRDQVMLPSGGVVLPSAADGLVEEFLARAVYRRATFAKAAMLVEESAGKNSVAMSQVARDSMARAVCSLMWTTGKDMVGAFRSPVDELIAAQLDDTWDVAVVEETPKMWLVKCWRDVVSSLGDAVFRDPAYWPTGVDRSVWDAASAVVVGAVVGASVVNFFVKEKVETYDGVPAMGVDREEAASKIVRLTGAEPGPSVSVVEKRIVEKPKPFLAAAGVVANPEDVMKEEFDREFPGLSMVDVDVRPYLVAEADRVVCPSAPMMKVPLVDKPVVPSVMLTTGFGVGVTGPRPRTVNEVVSAFVSRVAGAPSYQWDMDLEKSLEGEFDRFAAVFLKPNWQEDVTRRIEKGYMYPNEQDIRKVVGKMSPSNVSRVAREDFRAEGVLMTVLKAMTKREPKDRQDIGVAFDHKPNQTIMYQESKITNAYFSAALGKFHDCLDANLQDGKMINPRVDKEKVESMWNSANAFCEPVGGEVRKLLDIDISQCDKSQVSANILRYMFLLCKFGFGDFTRVWSKMIEMKRAADPSTSVLVEFLAQVVSGLFNTISANSCIVAWATANSLPVEPGAVRRVVVSGDDVVALIVGKGGFNMVNLTEDFSTRFNFDVKANLTDDVLYWCGRLGVEVFGYTFFVKDLGRIRSSYFKSQGKNYDAEEAWESFLDDTKAYDYEELVVGVAHAYARRMGLDFVPVGTARAIAALRRDKNMFLNRFQGFRKLG